MSLYNGETLKTAFALVICLSVFAGVFLAATFVFETIPQTEETEASEPAEDPVTRTECKERVARAVRVMGDHGLRMKNFLSLTTEGQNCDFNFIAATESGFEHAIVVRVRENNTVKITGK